MAAARNRVLRTRSTSEFWTEVSRLQGRLPLRACLCRKMISVCREVRPNRGFRPNLSERIRVR